MASQKRAGGNPPRPPRPGQVGNASVRGQRPSPPRPGQIGNVKIGRNNEVIATRPTGLGTRLGDIISRMEEAGEIGGGPLSTGRRDVLGTVKPPKSMGMGLGALIPSGPDFEVYYVSEAEEYYRGPGSSTCVAAHVFVPIVAPDEEAPMEFTENVERGMDELSDQFASVRNTNRAAIGDTYTTLGYTYVRFRLKNGAQGGLYKYGPMPLFIYRNFREFSSKGRGVRQILEPFRYQRVASVDGGPQI